MKTILEEQSLQTVISVTQQHHEILGKSESMSNLNLEEKSNAYKTTKLENARFEFPFNSISIFILVVKKKSVPIVFTFSCVQCACRLRPSTTNGHVCGNCQSPVCTLCDQFGVPFDSWIVWEGGDWGYPHRSHLQHAPKQSSPVGSGLGCEAPTDVRYLC